MDTTPTRYLPNAVSMLDQRLRRWPNIEPTLGECIMFEGKPSSQYRRGGQLFRDPRSNIVS